MNEANTPQQVLVYPQYPDHNEDEINLFDLWQALVRQKKSIFSVTAVITFIAILYAFLASPIYKSESTFLPPSDNDIQVLRVKDVKDVKDVNINTVYAKFRENLGSIYIRQYVFDKMKLAEQFEPEKDDDTNIYTIFNEFNENITLNIPKPKKDQFALSTTTLSLEGKDPVLISKIINTIGRKAEEATKRELISDIEAKVRERIKEINLDISLLLAKAKKQRLDEIERLETENLLERNKIEDQIKSLRDSEKNKRLDRIEQLIEASQIARTLKIKDPIDYKLKKIGSSSTTSQITTNLSNNSQKLYTLGYEAIDAEIASLTKRTNDAPYIKELRGLERKLKLLENNRKAEQLKKRTNDAPYIKELRGKENILAYYESIKIDPKNVKVARLDQAAYPPEKKIKPKRKLIIILGLILGLILGIFVAFIRNIQGNKEVQDN